jgi:tRNA dimethylallyltransferase
MVRRSLVAETTLLLKQGLGQNQTALQALGYRQAVEHLRGEQTLPETIERVKARTRQFARRQRTRYRHQAEARWISLEPGQELAPVIDILVSLAGPLNAQPPRPAA